MPNQSDQAGQNQDEQSSQGQEPKKSVSWNILNKTAKRILIDLQDMKEQQADLMSQYLGKSQMMSPEKEFEGLVIPSFGTINVHQDIIEALVLEPWKRQGLVEVTEVQDKVVDEDTVSGLFLGCGVWLVLFLAVGLIVTSFRTNWVYWGVVGIVAVFGLTIISREVADETKRKKFFANALRQFRQLVNLLLLLGLVFGGLGYLLFQFNRPEATLIIANGQLTMFGLERVLYFIFLSVVAILPALLYFLFRRRQLETVEERFIRDVMRLDPTVRTTTEAKIKYDPLLSETYGGSQTSGFLLGPGAPIFLSTTLIMIGWLVTLPFSAHGQLNDTMQLFELFTPIAAPINFAFLGAYFFALGSIFRRYVRSDLTPKAYTHIIIRLLLAIILTWIFSASPFFQDPANNEWLNVFAFIVGIFPDTGLTFLRNLLKDRLLGLVIPNLQDDHPLTRLEGINLFDQTRLLEEGIENVENLAHHNMLELLISTRIPAQRLVDMFDQAILYLHLGKDSGDVKDNLKALRAFGIRTATDLEEAYDAAKNRDALDKFFNILESADSTDGPDKEKQIQVILDVLCDDEWMQNLRYWRETSTNESDLYQLVGVTLQPK